MMNLAIILGSKQITNVTKREDWSLLSNTDLEIVYKYKNQFNSFVGSFYWVNSENEKDSNKAWLQCFDNGNQFSFNKKFRNCVRYIRKTNK